MILLSHHDILPDRSFTDLSHTPREQNVLRFMLGQLCLFLETILHLPELFDIIHHPDTAGRNCRYVVPRPPDLAKADNLAVVGFFGQKRLNLTPDHFGNLGESIMCSIPTYPDILGYCNMELDEGEFSNLVLLSGEQVKTAWMAGEDHTRAVDLSPSYYKTVRIYNGTLSGGVNAPETFLLTKVKYYDFLSDPPWRGERILDNPVPDIQHPPRPTGVQIPNTQYLMPKRSEQNDYPNP